MAGISKLASVTERLLAHICAGKLGYLGLWRENDVVFLRTQGTIRHVVHLQMDFTDGRSKYRATEEDFRGELLAGPSNDFSNVQIIWKTGEDPETVSFSSESCLLTGSLLVTVAIGQEQTWAESVVFSRGRGAFYFGSAENFVHYAHTVSKLVETPDTIVVGTVQL